ncbi:hypothetical protein EGW08_004171, partial [Elysia chlorotica]
NFATQRAECEALGGFLASARSIEKLLLVQDFTNGVSAWMGLDDQLEEGKLVWHDTGLQLTSSEHGATFAAGEPSNGGGVEHCIINNFFTRLNDVSCTMTYPAVCERPMS